MVRRLAPRPSDWIARDKPVSFTFEGASYRAYQGDTISSALLANGRRVLGRSFKYHRPRGVLSAANHDANVLLQTAQALNIRGDVTPVADGEAYSAVNTWGGVQRDYGQYLEWLAPWLPVGFYYKAFYRPRWAFPWWERLIRQISGLGRITPHFPTQRTPVQRVYCDCLVIGAGAAGLSAAISLAADNSAVLLIDENAQTGGRLTYTSDDTADFLQQSRERCARLSNLTLWTSAVAVGVYAEREVAVVTDQGLRIVSARNIIVATGLIEQPAVFRNNDLPGVMLASGAQRLVQRYAVAPCERATLLVANPEGYDAALELKSVGIDIARILDLDDPATRGDRAAAAQAHGIRVIGQVRDIEAEARHSELTAVKWSTAQGDDRIDCDGLLMSVGWAPAAQLLLQAGGRCSFDPVLNQPVPSEWPDGIFTAGSVNGHYALAARIADGEAAAEAVQARSSGIQTSQSTPVRETNPHSHLHPWFAHRKAKNFVDFDEDIQLNDLTVACREGFDNVELLKRYTTNGMGPSQGKHSNLNAARILVDYHGQATETITQTTSRPFYHPVPMGVLAGRRLRPVATSALDGGHAELDAEWMEAGAWHRPRYYRNGSAAQSREIEYRAVRERIGLIDVSTLGKFEVIGPDAAQLLNLCYTSAVDKTAVGMTRYVVMCDHRGIIVDDGVAARLNETRFYVTAGSGHALASYRQLTQVAALFKLNVEIIDVTRHLAAINIAGPHTRALLAPLTNLDLTDAGFPFLGIRTGTLCGFDVRMMRVGFVGEVGYEIHLPYCSAPALWKSLLELGRADDIRPFGVETQRLLRLEKGHLIVGLDTDGVTHPFETPLSGLVNFKKANFIGKAALEILREAVARTLVGFDTQHASLESPIEDCHLIIDGPDVIGRVTSVDVSPGLSKTIGLAAIERRAATANMPLKIRLSNGDLVTARITPTPFYDPTHSRQREA